MKILKYSSLITVSIYTVVYLAYSWTVWEFKNPLQWIIDIPTYDYEQRFAILFCWVIYYAALIFILAKTEDEGK